MNNRQQINVVPTLTEFSKSAFGENVTNIIIKCSKNGTVNEWTLQWKV